MRCILNRVLLALSWISIRAAADAQMLLKKQGCSPKLVLPVRDSEIPGGGFPEMLLQKGERLRSQVRARLNAEPLHPCRGDGSDPVKFGDRQGCDEVCAHFGGDDELAVRLALAGRKLGEELVVGDARRGSQVRVLEDARANL